MSYTGEGGEVSAVLVGTDDSPRAIMRSGTVGRFIAPGSLTGGRFGLFRWEMPAQSGGAGPHFHRTFSESFYVLSGSVALFDGRAWITGGIGDYLYIPEGGVHGFRNESDAPASMLILFAPGAPRERYFERSSPRSAHLAASCRRTNGPSCTPATTRRWSEPAPRARRAAVASGGGRWWR